MKFLLLAFLAGIVSACGFEPLALWPLTLAAFALLLALVERAPSLRGALACGYWFGVGQFTLGLNWIATAFTFQSNMPHWLGWIAVVLLSLYLAVYPAIAAGLAWRWSKLPLPFRGEGRGEGESGAARPNPPFPSPLRDSSLSPEGARNPIRFILIFAAAWIVTEWLRATMFTGFAWNPVGVALLPTVVAHLAGWIGTYGLSGVLALLAGLPFMLWRRNWRSAGILAAALALATGLVMLVKPAASEPTATPIRIVQPNIGQQDKWKDGFEERNFARLRDLSSTPDPGPRLLVWPEAAVTDALQDQRTDPWRQRAAQRTRERVAQRLGPRDMLLTGGITFRSRDGRTASSATNSVFAMDASGRILGRYDKAHLVPYGEYLPARPILSSIGLSRLAPGDIDFDSGPGPRTLDLPLVGKVGFQLCYEIIFSGEVVDLENRPRFIFNPSNDAWFGAWGPPQHLAQAQLRALEEGLPVLRSTPTGISAVIDAEGRLLDSLPWRTAGVIDTRLPSPKPPTLFARAGNILPFLFALLLVGMAIAVRRKTS